MRRGTTGAIGAVLLASCGGGGDGGSSSTLPPAAAALDSRIRGDIVRFAPLAVNAQSSFVFMTNPGSTLAQGVALTPDLSPGAPPNRYTLGGSFDGNGDGIRETTVAGSVTFDTDPDAGWSSLEAQMTLDVTIPVVGHVYHAELAYTMTGEEVRISGTGSFSNPLTGTTTSMTVPAGTPLIVRPATGAADTVGNACGYNLAGDVQVEVAGSAGMLGAVWRFLAGSGSVGMREASFRDAAGQSTALPDSTVDLGCGRAAGSISDWAATFDVEWVCLPRESGSFRTTIAVAGPESLAITDEGGTESYAAALVGGGPHAVRGFFMDGPAGNRYREDFSWTLRKDGGFSQSSVYRYVEGPLVGRGGICAATAKRVS